MQNQVKKCGYTLSYAAKQQLYMFKTSINYNYLFKSSYIYNTMAKVHNKLVKMLIKIHDVVTKKTTIP